MKEELFDLSQECEAMLNRGIGLSGEDMVFFIAGRLNAVRSRRHGEAPVTSCLDFGCGLGHTASRLARLFGDASITGAEASGNALQAAGLHNGRAAYPAPLGQ
jgi:2-polyprenyl-3-methyl-5-hydroxy-6-metoxy-1,4-benzoquinol methylase